LCVGKVEIVVGSSTLTRPGHDPAQIKRGDALSQGDIIETASGGKVGIRFIDGTVFSLSDKARMVVKEFSREAAAPSALFDITNGTFSFIAGAMAKVGRLDIETPFANIRGRTRSGGIGMLSLASLFFAAMEEVHASPDDGLFLDYGNIRFKDLVNDFGVVQLTTRELIPRTIFMDDPGETVVLRRIGSSISESHVTNSITQMLSFEGDQTNALRLFSLGQSGPAGNGAGGSGTPPPVELPPFIPINFVPVPSPGGGPTTLQGSGASGSAGDIFVPLPPAPPPPPPASTIASTIEANGQTGSSAPDQAGGPLAFSGVSIGAPSFAWSGGPLPPAQQSDLPVSAQLSFTGPNSTGFAFSVPDSSLDFLAVNETLTVQYAVTLTDGAGHELTQQVVVTLTGANDKPIFSSPDPNIHRIETTDAVGSPLKLVSSGSLFFTDADLNDQASAYTASVTAVAASGTTTGLPDQTTLKSFLTEIQIIKNTGSSSGQLDGQFSAPDSAFDYLSAGESVILKYTVQLDDGHGGIDSQFVTVTIFGTNDVPAITVGAGDDASATLAETNVPLTKSGTLTVNDLDLSDHVTPAVESVVASGATSGLGSDNAALLAMLHVSPGSINADVGDANNLNWSFNSASEAFSYLGTGQSLTLTYTVRATDGSATFDEQTITIIITGSENAPDITAVTTDSTAKTLAESNAALSTTGTLTVTDADVADTVTPSVASVALSGTTGGLTSSDVLGMLSVSPASIAANPGDTHNLNWSFNSTPQAFNFLAAGQSLALTYTVKADDGHSGSDTQTVIITITGTDDAPDITVVGSDSATKTLAETNAPLTTSGTLTVTDVDLADTIATTVDSVALSGTTSAAVLSMLSVSPASIAANPGDAHNLNWSFNSTPQAFDFLSEGQHLTLTYTVKASDGQGGTDTQTVDITINGTDEAPVLQIGGGAIIVDQFSTQNYGSWVESNDDFNATNGSPTQGDFTLAHDPLAPNGNFQIRLTDLDAEVGVPDLLTRTVNIAGATSATVSFDYRRDIPSGQSDDQFFVLASTDGINFTQIGQIGATGNGTFVDPTYQHFTFNLPASLISAHTIIQFSVGDNVDDGDVVWVNNFKVAYTTPATTQDLQVTYTENGTPVPISVFSQITDSDDTNMESAAITLTNPKAGDSLSVSNLAALAALGISVGPGDASHINLTGSASKTNYAAALGLVVFSSSSDNPDTTDRTVSVVVNDGSANSNTATATIHVAAVDDAPVVTSLNVAETHISFNIADPDNSAFALPAPFGNAFGNPVLGLGADSITPTEQATAVSGTLQVTDNAGGTADVIGLYLGTSAGNTPVTAPLASSPNAMYGFGGDDKLIGGSAADFLFGGAGNDILVGAGGNDTLTGGANADQFRLATNSGTDTITDYLDGTDKIGLLEGSSSGAVNFITSGTTAGAALGASDFVTRASIASISGSDDNKVIQITSAQSANDIQNATGAATPSNDYILVYDSTTGHGEIWFDSNWANTAGRTQVATLTDVTSLAQLTAITNSDIVVYSSAADPIVLDLGAPGVSLTTANNGVSFDINADGVRDHVAWTASNDGILAYDVNGSGTIDNGSELFTPNFAGGTFASGLAALASLDSNADGIINSADANFDAGELSSLTDRGISAINLDAAAANGNIDGQELQAQGSFTYTNGATGTFVEVALDTNFGTAAETSANPPPSPEGTGNNSTTIGGNGNDTIIAAVGNVLTGGAGSDTFVFKTVADSQPGAGHVDTITDFAHNSDHIDLTAIAGASHVQGLVAAANAVDANSVSWFVDNAHNETILYVNTSATANHVDMEIHLTGANINLTGADILHHT
jgi:VCBS repeat-containing protein